MWKKKKASLTFDRLILNSAEASALVWGFFSFVCSFRCQMNHISAVRNLHMAAERLYEYAKCLYCTTTCSSGPPIKSRKSLNVAVAASSSCICILGECTMSCFACFFFFVFSDKNKKQVFCDIPCSSKCPLALAQSDKTDVGKSERQLGRSSCRLPVSGELSGS